MTRKGRRLKTGEGTKKQEISDYLKGRILCVDIEV